jgi:uncharacterized membrane protein YcaP (DUF421 family)
MKIVKLGSLEANGKLLYIEERVPDTTALEQVKDFTVQLTVDGEPVELDLFKLRQLKRLLCDGERQLMLRHDQATRARNMTLDL